MTSTDSKDSSTEIQRLAAVPVRPKVVPMVQPPPQMTLPEVPEPTAAPVTQITIQRQEVSDVLLAAFAAMGFATSARFLLFLSLLGAFALAVMAMLEPTNPKLIVLGMYCVLTTLPLVALEVIAKRGKE